jgi:hypothetical protein
MARHLLQVPTAHGKADLTAYREAGAQVRVLHSMRRQEGTRCRAVPAMTTAVLSVCSRAVSSLQYMRARQDGQQPCACHHATAACSSAP